MKRFLVPLLSCIIISASFGTDVLAQTRPGIRIVVLGSSTSEGAGASNINHAWVQRFREYCREEVEGCQVINLARGGYSTYRLLPDEAEVSADRPQPDRGRNISEALRLRPDGIIINLPSNDAANGFEVEEQIDNYDTILAAAREAAVPVWITTTQPRNLDDDGRSLLTQMRDSTYARWGDDVIDFWTGLATDDGRLHPDYDVGDGIHLNDAGHALIFDRVREQDIPQRVLGTVKR